MYIQKHIMELAPGDNVVNIGELTKMEEFSNGCLLHFETGVTQFLRKSQTLVIEKSKLESLFKKPLKYANWKR